jgi:cell division septation protein DedD
MSFRSDLAGGKTTSEVDEAVAAIEKQRAAAKVEAAKPPPKPEPQKVAVVEAPKVEAPKPEPAKEAAPVAKPEPEPAPAPEKKPGKFTLQLSSFKEKVEAQSFLADMRIAGYRAYLVEAQVEGKGTFFRVRFGHYETYEDALSAKEEFEDKMQKIAYVTRL